MDAMGFPMAPTFLGAPTLNTLLRAMAGTFRRVWCNRFSCNDAGRDAGMMMIGQATFLATPNLFLGRVFRKPL